MENSGERKGHHPISLQWAAELKDRELAFAGTGANRVNSMAAALASNVVEQFRVDFPMAA